MRLRNILVLTAVFGFSLGLASCGKKAEETKPADTVVAPAPMPEPAPAPAPDSTMDTTKKM
jgi:hypothetical protein